MLGNRHPTMFCANQNSECNLAKIPHFMLCLFRCTWEGLRHGDVFITRVTVVLLFPTGRTLCVVSIGVGRLTGGNGH